MRRTDCESTSSSFQRRHVKRTFASLNRFWSAMTWRSPGRMRRTRRSEWVLEALEPRVLLSADFTAAQAATLGSGLQGLSDWANGLENFGALAQPLPVYVQSATDAPKTFTTIGGKVDLGN